MPTFPVLISPLLNWHKGVFRVPPTPNSPFGPLKVPLPL